MESIEHTAGAVTIVDLIARCGATGRVSTLPTIATLDPVFEVFDPEAAALDSFVSPSRHEKRTPR